MKKTKRVKSSIYDFPFFILPDNNLEDPIICPLPNPLIPLLLLFLRPPFVCFCSISTISHAYNSSPRKQ